MANDPRVAGKIFAQYIKDREDKIRSALQDNDLYEARRAVNGGLCDEDDADCLKRNPRNGKPNGLAVFRNAFQAGRAYLASQRPTVNLPGVKPTPLPDSLTQVSSTPPVLGDR